MEEGEENQRAVDRTKSKWVKKGVLLFTSLKVQSGFLGVNQLKNFLLLFLPSHTLKRPCSVLGLIWVLIWLI